GRRLGGARRRRPRRGRRARAVLRSRRGADARARDPPRAAAVGRPGRAATPAPRAHRATEGAIVTQETGAAEQRSFEEGMRELESIVVKLEQGNLPLEESLRAFESGVAMLRALHAKLGEVEQRVELLVRDADGVLRVRDAGSLTR